MNRAKFEIFYGVTGDVRFRLKAPNGEIVLQSEGYSSIQKCMQGLNAVKRYAWFAAIKDLRK